MIDRHLEDAIVRQVMAEAVGPSDEDMVALAAARAVVEVREADRHRLARLVCWRPHRLTKDGTVRRRNVARVEFADGRRRTVPVTAVRLVAS